MGRAARSRLDEKEMKRTERREREREKRGKRREKEREEREERKRERRSEEQMRRDGMRAASEGGRLKKKKKKKGNGNVPNAEDGRVLSCRSLCLAPGSFAVCDCRASRASPSALSVLQERSFARAGCCVAHHRHGRRERAREIEWRSGAFFSLLLSLSLSLSRSRDV